MRNNSRSTPKVNAANNLFDQIQANNGLAITNGSQFANISGMVSLEVEARETESKTTKLNKRIEALTRIEKDLVEVNASLAALYLCEHKEQRKKLRAALAMLDEYARVPMGAATPLRKAKNELISMREAVHIVSAATKKKREFTVVACLDALTEVRALLAKAKEKLADVHGEGRNASEVNAAEMGDILKKTEGHELPKINKSGYALGRAPVVPAVAVSAEKLNHAGFKAESSSGYTIIHNQLVLGVSKKFLEENKVKQSEAAVKLCAFLSRQMKTKLHLVSKHPAATQGLTGAAWYWVMPERELNALSKAAFGKAGDVRWGFAFNTK